MNTYALPLLRSLVINSLLARKHQDPIPRLERLRYEYIAPENALEKFRSITEYPNNGYLPLIWPFVAAWPDHMHHLTHPSFPLSLPGIVHAKNELIQHRPIGSGESLTLETRLEADPPMDRGIPFSLLTEVKGKEHVLWTARSSFLALRRGKSGPLLKPRIDIPLNGLGSESTLWNIEKSTALEYAGISGDINPIHLSATFAKLFGFDGVILHGNWLLSRIAASHEDLLDKHHVFFTCQFKKPIFLPQKVIYRYWREGDTIHFRVLSTKDSLVFAHGVIGQNPP